MSPTASVVPVGSWRSQDMVDKVRDGEEAKGHVDRKRRRQREGRRGGDSEPECTTPLLRQEEHLKQDKSLCGYSSVSQLRRSPRAASDLGLGCDGPDTESEVEVEVKPHRADASDVSDIPETAVDDDFQQACSSKKCFQSSNDDSNSISHPSRDLCKSRKRCRQKASDAAGEKASWSTLNPSLVLENNGSVARDHLASERTFLAYVRTSLALAGSGVGLVQLMQEQEMGAGATAYAAAKPLGCILVCFGLVVLGIGCTRFFSVQCALVQGHYPVARVVIVFMAIMLAALVVSVLGILVAEKV